MGKLGVVDKNRFSMDIDLFVCITIYIIKK